MEPLIGEAVPAPRVALLEVLDRDGQVRLSLPVTAWPVRVGRALDNDLVLSDPHVAPHHLQFLGGPSGPELLVGATRNGVVWDAQRLVEGARRTMPVVGAPVELTAGRSRLRLRLPGHVVPAERPLIAHTTWRQQLVWIGLPAAVLVASSVFKTYLGSDPDDLVANAGRTLLGEIVGAAVWCAFWALLSKTFTRQAQFGWHARVFLWSAVALMLVDAVLPLAAFAFSWPALSDDMFIATYALGAVAFYYHLIAVEPVRRRLMRGVAGVAAVGAMALAVWFHLQESDRIGNELYMSHLYPPPLRYARPAAASDFVRGLSSLQPELDAKAKKITGGGGSNVGSDDD